MFVLPPIKASSANFEKFRIPSDYQKLDELLTPPRGWRGGPASPVSKGKKASGWETAAGCTVIQTPSKALSRVPRLRVRPTAPQGRRLRVEHPLERRGTRARGSLVTLYREREGIPKILESQFGGVPIWFFSSKYGGGIK